MEVLLDFRSTKPNATRHLEQMEREAKVMRIASKHSFPYRKLTSKIPSKGEFFIVALAILSYGIY